MVYTTVRRQPSDESQLVHLSAGSSRLLWLSTCIIYLLFLRFLGALIGTFIKLPLWLKNHISRTESRIVKLATSLLRVVAGDTHRTTSTGPQRRGRPGRDERYSSHSFPNGPADDLIAPRHSSLEFDGMTEASYRQLDSRWPTHRPQAPRPPYRRGLENFRLSTTVSPPQPAVINRGTARTLGYDGAAASSATIYPIPALPVPSIPTFITRMPYISVSDSFYSSSSTGLLGRRHRVSTSSSSGRRAQVKSYTDLLSQRPSLDCDSPCRSSKRAQEHNPPPGAIFQKRCSVPGKVSFQ